MDIPTLVRLLDDSERAAESLRGWRIANTERARQMLAELADAGLTLDLLAALCQQLEQQLPRMRHPDRALAALRDFLLASRSPLALAALLVRDASATRQLLAALTIGLPWTQRLLADPEAFDYLRETGGQPLTSEQLAAELKAEIAAFVDERAIAAALARFWWRHLLRIAYGETALRHRLELVLQQQSYLYEALLDTAWQAAQRLALAHRPALTARQGALSRASVLAMGGLGAAEPGYFPRLELLVVYEPAADDASQLRAQAEHFERSAKLFERLVAEEDGSWPRVSLRLLALPEADMPRAAHTIDDAALGFQNFGRTWHRQQLLQARAVAGSKELGEALVERLAPWLFRRYLTRPDEAGIKALKRRILLEATMHQDDWRDARHARGGLRDLEATIHFLQLLFGGDEPEARSRGMLDAIAGLERAGALTVEDRVLLDGSFVFLRRIEHRLQLRGGSADSEWPASAEESADFAEALSVDLAASDSSASEFLPAYRGRLKQTWQTLHKLLAAAFPEEPAAPREVQLLLDPAPHPDEVRAALAPFGFVKPEAALEDLERLAAEPVPFLSTRRCRHALSLILPKLLVAVGATPNPDRTLSNLLDVSNSLGGKAALFELFRVHGPSLQLYVTLCAASPYLSGILTTNPGMIDELVDSLQLDRLTSRAELELRLADMTRGRRDPLPPLYDFKNAQHLHIGVRDILGREDIDGTHRALADVAEVCLGHVVRHEYERLVEKHGIPTQGPGSHEGAHSRLVILGLGKLGGREPNYHSELDVAFLYEAEGVTQPSSRARREQRTANNHFYTQLAQRVMKQLAQLTPKGRLYAIDAQLRPIGIAGAVALSVSDFAQQFSSGAAPLWQWQVLTQARPVFGEATLAAMVQNLIHRLLAERVWQPSDWDALRRNRLERQTGASERNLKRGAGGTLDIECLVQMLQLKAAATRGEVLAANTLEGLDALTAAGVLERATAETLGDNYRFLRRLESALRLLNTASRHDLPESELELRRLALLLGHSNPQRLAEQCLETMAINRQLFDRLTAEQTAAIEQKATEGTEK